jgi:uncharacterized protein YdaU (DUF1376 family)
MKNYQYLIEDDDEFYEKQLQEQLRLNKEKSIKKTQRNANKLKKSKNKNNFNKNSNYEN